MAVWALRGDTPVVRASGRELSLVLLGGIMMCYLVTFALVFRPTDVLCSLQRYRYISMFRATTRVCKWSIATRSGRYRRFGTGFCFTVVYAALLTKTNRIARIFDASKHSARRPSLISPKSQLFICSVLVSIQVKEITDLTIYALLQSMLFIYHHSSYTCSYTFHSWSIV